MVVSIDECVATVGIPVAARAMPKIIGAILPELHMAFRQSLLTLAISRHRGVWDRNGYCAMAWNSLWLTIFCLAKLCQKKTYVVFIFAVRMALQLFSSKGSACCCEVWAEPTWHYLGRDRRFVEHVMTL